MKMNTPLPGSQQDQDGESAALLMCQASAAEYHTVLFSPFLVLHHPKTLEQVSSLRFSKTELQMQTVLHSLPMSLAITWACSE